MTTPRTTLTLSAQSQVGGVRKGKALTRPPLIPTILIGGGWIVMILAAYPIFLSDWLTRPVQALIGSGAVIVGAALVEIKSWRAER